MRNRPGTESCPAVERLPYVDCLEPAQGLPPSSGHDARSWHGGLEGSCRTASAGAIVPKSKRPSVMDSPEKCATVRPSGPRTATRAGESCRTVSVRVAVVADLHVVTDRALVHNGEGHRHQLPALPGWVHADGGGWSRGNRRLLRWPAGCGRPRCLVPRPRCPPPGDPRERPVRRERPG